MTLSLAWYRDNSISPINHDVLIITIYNVALSNDNVITTKLSRDNVGGRFSGKKIVNTCNADAVQWRPLLESYIVNNFAPLSL